MLFSFLVGYAIGTLIGIAIAEICIQISSYWNAESEIRNKAKEKVSKPISILEVYVKEHSTYEDEEELVIKAYDNSYNHIANIKVTATNGTKLKVGDRF